MATKPTIQERTKAAVNAAPAASMVPEALAPPPKEEEVIPSVKDLVKDKKDLLAIRRLMTAHMEHGAIESEHRKAKEKITAQLKALVGRYKIGKAEFDGDRVNYFASPRSTIKAALLLANGVPSNVITACTETTTSYTLKITAAKTAPEGEES